jgi:hypothetical protein
MTNRSVSDEATQRLRRVRDMAFFFVMFRGYFSA